MQRGSKQDTGVDPKASSGVTPGRGTGKLKKSVEGWKINGTLIQDLGRAWDVEAIFVRL